MVSNLRRFDLQPVNNRKILLPVSRKSLRADSVVRSCGASRAVFDGVELVIGLRAWTMTRQSIPDYPDKKPSFGLAKHCP